MTATTRPVEPAPSASGMEPAATGGGATNRTTVIVLSSVLPVVGVIVAAAFVYACCRYRKKRGRPFFPRGISPIGDDEIETWKVGRPAPPSAGRPEKEPVPLVGAAASGDGDAPSLPSASALGAGVTVQKQDRQDGPLPSPPTRARGISLDSAGSVGAPRPLEKRTPSNVVVYQEDLLQAHPQQQQRTPLSSQPSAPAYRRSEEMSPRSARSLSLSHSLSRGMAGRLSLDQGRDAHAPAALQRVRAPNARAGLTDEAIPGDPSYLPPPPKRQQLPRLLKSPRSPGSPAGAHARSASSSSQLSQPSPAKSYDSGVAVWHARSRSARTNSSVSGRSIGYAGSELASSPSSLGLLSLQRRPSEAQLQRLHSRQHPRSGSLSFSLSSRGAPGTIGCGGAVPLDERELPLLGGLSLARPPTHDGLRAGRERSSSLEHLESIGRAIG